ncbi:MAG: hypothetical protein AAB839_00020 [Patescibacteria group bacterium]
MRLLDPVLASSVPTDDHEEGVATCRLHSCPMPGGQCVACLVETGRTVHELAPVIGTVEHLTVLDPGPAPDPRVLFLGFLGGPHPGPTGIEEGDRANNHRDGE